MKTFKQFKEDNQYVSEGAGAIIGGAFKLGSKALAAYSAYKAGDSLLKGKPKEAAVNAIGAVPGGRVFKGMKKKLTSAKTRRDPDSRINKALRRWNC